MPPRLIYFVATVSPSGIKLRKRWEKRSRCPGKAGGGQGTKRDFSWLSEPIVPPILVVKVCHCTSTGQFEYGRVRDDEFVDAWRLSLMEARGLVGRVKRLRRERGGGIKAMLPKVTKVSNE